MRRTVRSRMRSFSTDVTVRGVCATISTRPRYCSTCRAEGTPAALAHARAVGRQSRTNMQVDTHHARDRGAGDIDNIVSIQRRDREALMVRRGEAFEYWLRQRSTARRRGGSRVPGQPGGRLRDRPDPACQRRNDNDMNWLDQAKAALGRAVPGLAFVSDLCYEPVAKGANLAHLGRMRRHPGCAGAGS